MGRLIDVDEFLERVKKDREHEIYLHSWTADDVLERLDSWYAPTVEAIPKADYEARLRADMVAMLEQLDSEIQEQIAFMGDGEETNGMKRAGNLVKDKINALKQSIWQDNYNGKKENK